jgi:PAS domain S-box-containing protein
MDKKLKILMLDANASDANAIEKELERAVISFTAERVETKDGFEASLREFGPDLVLSDYWLPSFDGISALNLCLKELPDVPFIFVSGALGEELAIDAMKNGATDYVLKVGLSRLVPAVRRALRESEERAERKLAESKLRESEERLKTILGSVSTGVVIIDPGTHKIVDANPAAVDMIGFPHEGVVGQTCHKFICPAQKGACPVTDLGQDLDREERVLLTASGDSIPILKTVTRVVLDGREHLLESFVDISESKKMEKALRESEDAARTLLNVPVGSFSIIDKNGVVIAMNETGANMLGKESRDLIGTRVFSLFPDDVGTGRSKKVKEVIRTGKAVRYEDEWDGKHYDNNLFPLFDEKGKVSRIAVFAQEITERKQVEIAQKKDRDLLSKVLDTAGALVLVLEPEGRIVLFNRTAELVSGYSFAEVRGKRPWEVLLDPPYLQDSRRRFKDLAAGKKLDAWETVWRTRDGQSRNIASSSASLLDEDGRIEYIILTATDVTESRLAEAALKESEERYRTVFESTGTAMCIVDSAATITFLNSEFERISGFDRDKAVGSKKFTEFLVGEKVDEVTAYCADMGDGEGAAVPIHFECTFRPRKGDDLQMMANMGLLPGTGAGSSAVSLIDVTREKAYEEDLKERAERLRDFLVVASHELRHPIAIVKGYANTLKEYLERMPPELVQEILQDIDLSTDRLTRYVEQLLDVSRVEQGRLFINREPSDPELLLKMALEDTKVMGFGNKFTTRVSAGTGPIEVDAQKFTQLVNILVDNAVKFSPAGSPIDIELERKGREIEVGVLDRGNGIPAAASDKIFDRFYQVEDALHHSKPGMGLGLYIAKQIVDAHGGRIWVEPREGGGSAFRFTVA